MRERERERERRSCTELYGYGVVLLEQRDLVLNSAGMEWNCLKSWMQSRRSLGAKYPSPGFRVPSKGWRVATGMRHIYT
jgi:hypothetical protein